MANVMTYRQAIEAAKRQPNWTPCSKTWGSVTTVVAWNSEYFKRGDNRFRVIRWRDGFIEFHDWVQGTFEEMNQELNKK